MKVNFINLNLKLYNIEITIILQMNFSAFSFLLMKPIQMIGVLSFSKYMERRALPGKNYIRGNKSPFMNKTMDKEIMKRTKLINNFLKNVAEDY